MFSPCLEGLATVRNFVKINGNDSRLAKCRTFSVIEREYDGFLFYGSPLYIIVMSQTRKDTIDSLLFWKYTMQISIINVIK